ASLLIAAAAHAQRVDRVLLEDMTWTEVATALNAGRTTIIVPIGGTEQNGPHMVLGKHNVRVKVLAERIALALGNALVAPVIAYVPEGSIDPPAAHVRIRPRIDGPQLQAPWVSRYRIHRRSRQLSEERAERRRTAES